MSKLNWKNPPRDKNIFSSGIDNIKGIPRPTNNGIPIYHLHEKLPFGKHKGERISKVIEEDNGWIKWAIREELIFIKENI